MNCQILRIYEYPLFVNHQSLVIVFVLDGICKVKRFSRVNEFKEGDVFFINPPMASDSIITIMDFIMGMLGLAGAFVVGVGLFNLVAAWIHQYLGHLLTAACLLGGTGLTLFSMYLLYK